MGFFKKIGSSIKKATKEISFKNLVKVATPLLSAVPIVGGFAQSTVQNLSASHQAKKDGRAEESAFLQAQAMQNLGTVAGGVVGSGAGVFGDAMIAGAYEGLSSGVKRGVSNAGVGVVDMTIKAWFVKHWKHLLMVLGGIVALVIIWKQFLFNSNSKGARTAKRR